MPKSSHKRRKPREQIKGSLVSAKLVDGPPSLSMGRTRGKIKSCFKKGFAYENAFERFLNRQAIPHIPHQWVLYEDAGGSFYAQFDEVIPCEKHVVLLELKLTYRFDAWKKINRLYRPLVREIWQKPVTTVQVFKSFPYGRRVPTKGRASLQEILHSHIQGNVVLHFTR